MTTVPLLPFLRRSLPTTLLAGVVVSGLIVMARGPGLFFVDGPIFLDASQRLLAGQPLYIEGFYGPPWMAVLYTPFTLLPLGLKYTLLYYLGLVLVGVSAWVLLASTKWRWQRRLLFTGLCLIFPPSAWAV
ncbi:MAG: hypothetical protein HW403_1213, partial [Dehalococcoidia bacterium]|nr:hypothetical protein [Dehalococcoidia bacterium]